MKLTDLTTAGAGAASQLDGTRDARTRDAAKPRARNDRVDVSGLARDLAAAIQAHEADPASGPPLVDASRLEALRQAIESGTLEVDADALANAIVDADLGDG